ncbi:hypothetical protein HYN59_00860 [Flavobacterium album]|uniref:Lipocalin-like domain-containing protein n=1 Tax=Flavobacterium album TaxID=2175091 RepID=A0A2S1QU15_9FLAO|nr:hypothetical protein [Flavobacterium album]AWH83751.1 hypothetical protein HYN59_00860 [Flavobacterium album]
MENKLFTVLAFLFVFAANAQKITEKDLLGKWNIISLTISGDKMDFKTGTITVSEDWQKDGLQIAKSEREVLLKESLPYFRTTNVTFFENRFLSFRLGPEDYSGNYAIVEEGGITYIQAENSAVDRVPVMLKEGLLYWELAIEEDIFYFVFEKAVK